MQFRGTHLEVTLEGGDLTVEALADGHSPPVRIGVGDEASWAQATAARSPSPPGPAQPRTGPMDGFAADLRRGRRARGLAPRTSLGRRPGGAHGDALGRHSPAHHLCTRALYVARVSERGIGQAAHERRARAALDYFEVPDAADRVEAYAERKQEMVVELIEAGEFTAFPDALRCALGP